MHRNLQKVLTKVQDYEINKKTIMLAHKLMFYFFRANKEVIHVNIISVSFK